jgi:diguanylate cyclase (GGDEF)-like protein
MIDSLSTQVRARLGLAQRASQAASPTPWPRWSDSPRALSLAGALLFAGGGLIGLLALLVPAPPGLDEVGVIATSLVAFTVALALLAAGHRLPPWSVPALAALGTLLVTSGIAFGGEGASVRGYFYLWVVAFAAYFLPWRWAAAQVLLIGVALAAVLAIKHIPSGLITWLVSFGTAVFFALLIGLLRKRVNDVLARLHEAARTDPLTGLANRRSFRELFEHELERARRGERSLSLAIADLDFFKRVNDTLGHDGGDEVLRSVASCLRGGRRASDVVARLGGEEFALVMAESDPRQALVATERLRARLQHQMSDASVPLTISFGIASFPNHGGSSEQLLYAADRALFAAKALGRDRSVIYSAQVDTVLAASQPFDPQPPAR